MQRHFHREQPPAKTPAPAAGPKPRLEMVQLPIFRVHYRRLEDYLVTVYHMTEFDFLKASGAGPGLVPEYGVSAVLPPAQDAQRRADAIRAGRRTQDVPLILTTLCIDGYIPPGKYIIDTRPEPPPIDVLQVDPRQPQIVLASVGTAFFARSTDGGRNWIPQTIPVNPQMWGISFVGKKK